MIQIDPRELLKGNWKKPNRGELSPHICDSITWFNTLTIWIQYVIVSVSNTKYRAQVFSLFVNTAYVRLFISI